MYTSNNNDEEETPLAKKLQKSNFYIIAPFFVSLLISSISNNCLTYQANS